MSKQKKTIKFEILKNFSRKIPTNDDWRPSYDDGTVETYCWVQKRYPEETFTFKVGVWGADDFGLEMIKSGLNQEEAFDYHNMWVVILSNLAYASQDDFRNMGLTVG